MIERQIESEDQYRDESESEIIGDRQIEARLLGLLLTGVLASRPPTAPDRHRTETSCTRRRAGLSFAFEELPIQGNVSAGSPQTMTTVSGTQRVDPADD